MQKVVHPKTMYQMDQDTLKSQNISSYDLLMRAGKQLFETMQQDARFIHANKVLVVAGMGHNGGDALVVAEEAIAYNKDVTILMIGSKETLSKNTKTVLKRIEASKTEVFWNIIDFKVNAYDLIIDGLFGIGLSRSLSNDLIAIIKTLNEAQVPIFSIDIPSGLNAETGMAMPIALNATKTYIIQYYKFGNLLNQANDYHGEKEVIDIGIESKLLPDAKLLEASRYYHTLPKRKHFSHKYNYGNVLIYMYQATMLGAGLLSANAALRTGAGLVRTVFDKNQPFHVYPNDLVMQPIQTIEELKAFDKPHHAMVFGPGLGREKHHQDTLEKLLKASIPMVIDADGLYHLKPLLNCLPKTKPLVLTPHVGEFSRLFNIDKTEVYEKIIERLEDYKELNVAWIIKGPTTIVYYQGECLFSDFGHPALATAGTGDVLSGIIAVFLSREFSPLNAAIYALIVHGLSAQEGLTIYGEESMLASDLIEAIPKVIKLLKEL